MRVSLSVPAGNERGPLYMDQAFAVIHQANPHRLPLSLELGRDRETLSFSRPLPSRGRGAIVEGQLYAQYPGRQNSASNGGDPLRRPSDMGRRVVAPTGPLSDPAVRPVRGCSLSPHGRPADRSPHHPRPETHRFASTQRRASRAALPSPKAERALRCLRSLSRPFFRHHHRTAHLYVSLALSPRRSLRISDGCSPVSPTGRSLPRQPRLSPRQPAARTSGRRTSRPRATSWGNTCSRRRSGSVSPARRMPSQPPG